MDNFKAEYMRKNENYGYSICMADTITDLIKKLEQNEYMFQVGQKENIIKWSQSDQKKYYGRMITIYRGDQQMTEYTSF